MQELPINARLLARVDWTIKERQDGLWVTVKEFHNLVTNYGLTALASAPAGQYLPPQYLVIDSASTTINAAVNPGDTTVQLLADPTIAGDTQLVLSVGLAAQEVVTITGPGVLTTGFPSNYYLFTLTSPAVNAHAQSDPAVRQVTASDTMASVMSEAQYDPTFNANQRSALTAAFSPGTGQNTMQFFISGTTATNLFFAHVGLADQPGIGTLGTNLHNYAPLGYSHSNTNDLEIDVNWTLQTF